MIRRIITGCICFMLLAGCSSDILVSEKWQWDDQQWVHSDPKTMVIEATDTTTAYTLIVKVDHLASYGYQNLYVRTRTTFPSGKEVSSVTSLELTDAPGRWAGDCSGKRCSVELPLQQRFTFPETGVFTWTIEPYMRVDTIQGILALTATCKRLTSE